MATQEARFAGSFYTSEPIPLNRNVRLLTQAGKVGRNLTPSRPIAIVAPHAGYRFSGSLAGQAYAAVLDAKMEHSYDRIVILSPSHKHRFDGLAMPSWSRFKVPNGVVNVDKMCRNDLLDRKLVHINDAAHENEHGIETQLPFMARYLHQAQIVPIVVGRAKLGQVAQLIDYLADESEVNTLFVLSSDLSHFHDRAKAMQLDAATAQMIETADAQGLDGTHACGWMPLAGFLTSNHGAGARAVRLAMGDSSVVTGDENRVVGYGAWAIYQAQDQVLNDHRRKELLRIARASLSGMLKNGRAPHLNMPTFAAPMHTTMASFVTLSDKGRLRGCIGSLQAHQPLVQDVATNAVKAGTKDPRFKPLTNAAQLDGLDLKIAVLTKAAPISFVDRDDLEARLRPGVSGLILQDQGKRGTFLPMVWDSLDTPKKFLDGLIVKAGLPKGYWSETVKIWHYQAESFAES